jgi:hypothetical protein
VTIVDLRSFQRPKSIVRSARMISSTNGMKSGTTRSTKKTAARRAKSPGKRRFIPPSSLWMIPLLRRASGSRGGVSMGGS